MRVRVQKRRRPRHEVRHEIIHVLSASEADYELALHLIQGEEKGRPRVEAHVLGVQDSHIHVLLLAEVGEGLAVASVSSMCDGTVVQKLLLKSGWRGNLRHVHAHLYFALVLLRDARKAKEELRGVRK